MCLLQEQGIDGEMEGWRWRWGWGNTTGGVGDDIGAEPGLSSTIKHGHLRKTTRAQRHFPDCQREIFFSFFFSLLPVLFGTPPAVENH